MISKRTRSFATCIGMLALVWGAAGCGDAVSTKLQAGAGNDGDAIKEGFRLRPLPGAARPGEGQTVAASETGRYLVHFKEPSVAQYFGETRRQRKTVQGGPLGKRLNMAHPAMLTYRQQLLGIQQTHVAAITALVGRNPVERTYTAALNAVAVSMDHAEALRVAKLRGVEFVEPEQIRQLVTDRGPSLIGAPGIWDGSASGVASKGENMVVGIIDSGIAFNIEIDGQLSAHPSFDATGDDGYTVVNPLGDGVYLGACVEHPEWCNAKFIGAYGYGPDLAAPNTDIIYNYKDIGGHGSHVASTAAGNVVYDAPVANGDGDPSGVTFPEVSGVAPHANLISYKVCKRGGCSSLAIAAAVDQAIQDGIVDVINHSISSSTGSPWRDGTGLSFLAAREAGIFVASAAGNEGPAPATGAYTGSAPWAAAVAATTHDRSIGFKGLTDLSGGDTPAPTGIVGKGFTGGFTGPIVYAGNYKFGAPGDLSYDRANLCVVPFPAGTFTPDTIVMCDRGVNGRVEKGMFVRAGGAGAMILGNVTGGGGSVDPDLHVIPTIHIAAAPAATLRTWLATGAGHAGTIQASPAPSIDPAAGDIMADFSSRGPYPGFDFLGPTVAAPGVNIMAAGSAFKGAASVPGRFGIISGTSMASPHVAGVATLVKAVRPDWSNAEILSALITTGVTAVRKENRVTPADVHDMGGGRVQVDAAVRAGLLFDETAAGFRAGNPEEGGDPGQLNVAQLVRQSCVVKCGWKRTVTAAVAGSWTLTGPSYMTITPSQFTLAAGEQQELSISVDATSFETGKFQFGSLLITPASPALAVQHVPSVVRALGSNLPTQKELVATRDQGSSAIRGVQAVQVDALTFRVSGMGVAEQQAFEVGQDSDNAAFYDDVADGAVTTLVTVPENTEMLIVEISKTDATDLDLRIGIDENGDGLPSEDEEVCVSATGAALERCPIDFGDSDVGGLTFWISVQNWEASAPDAIDAFTLSTIVVPEGDTGNLIPQGPLGVIAAGTPWDLTLNWTSPPSVGGLAYGKVRVYRNAAQDEAGELGEFVVRLSRAADDVSMSLPGFSKTREAFPVRFTVGANYEEVARNYQISVPLPAGVSHVAGSGGTRVGNNVVLSVSTAAGVSTPTTVEFSAQAARSVGGKTLTFNATNTVNNPNSLPETTSADITLSSYAFSGFLSPRPGSTILWGAQAHIRFQVSDAASGRPRWGVKTALEIKNAEGAVVASDTDTTGLFGNVSYWWSTRGLPSGVYQVTATLDDGSSYSMDLKVKQFSW